VAGAEKLVTREAPGADCIVISGDGIRTADLVKPLEYDLQKPETNLLLMLI